MTTISDKYPRTPHLPWSPGCTSKDRVMHNTDSLLNRELVMTEKLDGSNVSFSRSDVFARSHSGNPQHPSFDRLKAIHTERRWYIPNGLTLFGEWCYTVHSIEYEEMPWPGPYIFAIRDERHGVWLSWEDTVDITRNHVGLPNVPVLHTWVSKTSHTLQQITSGELNSIFGGPAEGIVVRTDVGFRTERFAKCVAKWVRKDHVQTDQHWSKGRYKVQNFTRSK